MEEKTSKSVVYILGDGFVAKEIYKKLRDECRVYQVVPKNKKIDYIFYVEGGENPDIKKILELTALNRAKLLLLLPRDKSIDTSSLISDHEESQNLDMRVVRAPKVIFGDPTSKEEKSYIKESINSVLDAMFGGETRGGLFLLPEPPFNDLVKDGETRQSSRHPRSVGGARLKFNFSFRWLIALFLLSFIIPTVLMLVFWLAGSFELILFKNSFFKGQTARARIFAEIALPTIAISQRFHDLLSAELGLIKKEEVVRDFGILIGATADLARGGLYLTNSTITLQKLTNNIFFNKKPDYNYSEDLVRARLELLQTQEELTRAQLALRSTGHTKKLAQEIDGYRNLFSKTMPFLDAAPSILGIDNKKTYLVLLQNNMEIRPTGGFIGSYGLLSFDNGRFLGFEIFDVYSADGQLKGHVEPPLPIRKYLNQPHWFLRDSNWDPSFEVSAQKASWFLEKEVGQKVDGVVAMDVSLVRLIIGAMDNVYLPDYQETITQDNLFERAHFWAHKDFFPGSTSKRDFLSTLATMTFDKLTNDKNISFARLFGSLATGIEEKHLMLAFNDPQIQRLFLLNNMSGSITDNRQEKEGQLNDLLMIIDSNLGVNKVNYFIKRNINKAINIGEYGDVSSLLKITYTNQSPTEDYKNYLRIITPIGTKIGEVKFDGNQLKEVDIEESGDQNIFGFLVNIPAQSQKKIEVRYELQNLMPIVKGLNKYSLRVLKQPGTDKDPLTISIAYPSFFDVQKENQGEGKIFYDSQRLSIASDLSRDREFEVNFLAK